MDNKIDETKWYEGKHIAEAYHAGDESRKLAVDDCPAKRQYLKAKYPLIQEYQAWEHSKYR